MQSPAGIEMIVTDLDGTLLNSLHEVSQRDRKTLHQLEQDNVIRVIATGRSPYSFSKVIPSDFPIDYLIFSSGAGAMNWKTKEIIYKTEISANEVQNVVNELMIHEVDFMVHESIPSNHRFLYHDSGNNNPDFHRRIEIYNQFCQPFIPGIKYDSPATQILAVLSNDVEWFERLKNHFPALKVIRATSPLDGHSIWMEIFRKDVSKAFGIEQIRKKHGVDSKKVITLGNDYNDLDMLRNYKNSFVVSNAPEDLKKSFSTVKSNNDSGFSDLVEKFVLL